MPIAVEITASGRKRQRLRGRRETTEDAGADDTGAEPDDIRSMQSDDSFEKNTGSKTELEFVDNLIEQLYKANGQAEKQKLRTRLGSRRLL